MIVELKGIFVSYDPPLCVVDVGGVGYGVEIAARTARELPRPGQPVHLLTHLIVREDGWRLIGFGSPAERQRFLDVMAVNGVGVKSALALLDHLGVEGLEDAVRRGRWQLLKEVPGIGAKLAQRVQLELTGKWGPAAVDDAAPVAAGAPAAGDELVDALVGLGYSVREASAAVEQIPAEGDPAERLRAALRRLDHRRGNRES